ncbi:DUF1592 domain-containing protein [Akkermansiaceae bacterium]|nr:DUF1592 domain-containing protein [Akkermansiaceae bacterium]MDB4702334.1 DUF1592 domain-containing protein [Akkermansiaceae bacterium]
MIRLVDERIMEKLREKTEEINLEEFIPMPLFDGMARIAAIVLFLSLSCLVANDDVDEFKTEIRPLLDKYCFDCHSTEEQEGELDLERFDSLEAIRSDGKVWQLVKDQLELGEMPPKKKLQLPEGQRADVLAWVRSTLKKIGEANAGDPGPVVVRRLSNAEYTYSLRDLTGVETLDPAHEFPVDGAAGEGFTNAGAALVMSPSLFTKYLDAAKEVSKHAVFLPDGIAFSEKTTRRDLTDQKLAAIRAFYNRYSKAGGGTAVNLQGIKFDTKDGGLLPLQHYLAVALEGRADLITARKSIEELARNHGVNAKYLGKLWKALNDAKPSLLLDPIRSQWRESKSGDAQALADAITRWQSALWRFTTVGHIGKRDGPKAWQEPVDPLMPSKEFRIRLPTPTNGKDLEIYLHTSDAGDGEQGDFAIWENPRILHPKRPPVSLVDAEALAQRVDEVMTAELGRTSSYLELLAESHQGKKPVHEIAQRNKLDVTVAGRWAALMQLGQSALPEAKGHFVEKRIKVAGNPDIRAWGPGGTPSLTGNASVKPANFSTITMPARSVIMHPSPTKEAIVYWRSPIAGKIGFSGFVADADGNCGNGIEWRVDLVSRTGIVTLAKGLIDNGARKDFDPKTEIAIQPGDLVQFAINPRNRDYACDSTVVELAIREVGGKKRIWNLAEQVVDRLHDSNPLADTFGNADVWHFCASEIDGTSKSVVPPGSVLANWRAAVIEGKTTVELKKAAGQVQSVLLESDAAGEADKALCTILLDWNGPLEWAKSASGIEVASEDIRAAATSTLAYRIPAALASGAELVTRVSLHPLDGKEGCVQMRVLFTAPVEATDPVAGSNNPKGGKKFWSDGLVPVESSAPFIVNNGSKAWNRLEADIEAFRNLFPAALCYTKIVPVDEVVTLTLFHREDHHLRRLMLDEAEAKQLDKLWSELHFVSEGALQLVDAFEQLWQFATQDADPSAFTPMREPIKRRAEVFKKARIAAEPNHVDSILAFAGQAWRRPLTMREKMDLRMLYKKLREKELTHEAAARLTLARVLVAPAFLYKLESPQPGKTSAPVNDLQLASRLSYFLWSSAPDEELMSLATSGKLKNPDVLLAQAQRMLKDKRVRRLAIEFGSQWLHVRDFDSFDEKSERHFPEFAAVRSALGEEPVRFFTNFFQDDGSVLNLLNADHTFMNGRLAKYYGIGGSDDAGWRRVAGVRAKGRGGILGFGATLAKQSGASRTSPILRGAWISETLLGERLPRPPKGIPVLGDAPPKGLTERALTERHVSDPACARCHARIDPFGFSLENYDAIGRFRLKDNADLPIDASAKLLDGTRFSGADGLRDYLLNHRRDDFIRQFSRKLLGYALGRSVLLSDEPLLDEIQLQLVQNDYQISQIIESIVLSRQFREIRGRDHSIE